MVVAIDVATLNRFDRKKIGVLSACNTLFNNSLLLEELL